MSNKTLLTLAFLEGISVILIELLGGKMLIPYFGNSLIIWTSTIGVTMSSLMFGYFLGGFLSKFRYRLLILYFSIIVVALWVIILPSLVSAIINALNDKNLYYSSVLASIILYSLPLILLGSTPTIIIEELTKNNYKNSVGLASGKVFFISTVGAIFSALFFGFLIIENYGISTPLIVYGIILFLSTSILLKHVFKEKIYFLLIALPIFLFSFSTFKKKSLSNVLYHSESLQGQLKIIDENTNTVRPRLLQINGVTQTKMLLDFNAPHLNRSIWWYVHMDAAIASHKPKNSNTLLLGFGGGSIANELINLEMNLDVVEIDGRLPNIAHDYFMFDTTNANFHIDDARHFIRKNQNKKKYDLVVIDLLHGEVQPNHIFTLEGLEELKNILTKDATVIVNYQSNYDEPNSPYLAILNTLWKANYDAVVTDYIKDRPSDYIFIASPNKLTKNIFNTSHMNDCCFNNKGVQDFIQNPIFIDKNSKLIQESTHLITLTDNQPILETMNKETIKTWRKNMIEQATINNSSLLK